ncbi:MAG: site-2 protease family protein [Verrucomicrobiota bacterium]
MDVFLHWSWFLVAWYFLSGSSQAMLPLNIAVYVSLFLIVLIHEFGHVLASRQVGGESREILLWPFGGIAFVKTPPRPGAELWAIAAGPLVNVVLYPILYWVIQLGDAQGWWRENPEIGFYFVQVFAINQRLLLFNLLPIFPLDGGQMLRALLWFKLGRAQSLRIATTVGLIGIPVVLAGAVYWGWIRVRSWQDLIFPGSMAALLAYECYRSYKHAHALKQLAALPRHTSVACPTCHEQPPGGPLWACGSCGNRFDPFSTRSVCPHCNTLQPNIPCVHCGSSHPIERWDVSPPRRPGDPPVIEM